MNGKMKKAARIIILIAVIILIVSAAFGLAGHFGFLGGSADVNAAEKGTAHFAHPYGVFLGLGNGTASAGAEAKILKRVKDYRIVVIDADTACTGITKDTIDKLHAAGHTVYTYINIGAVENYRTYYRDWKSDFLGRYENWPDEQWVDVSDAAWQKFVTGELAEKYLAMGVDGFFCDNSDVYYKYKKEGIYSGLVQILHGLRATGKDVVLNGGDTFAHRYMKGRSTVTDAFTAVNQESVYSRIRSYNGNGKFGVQKKADTRYYVHRLQEAGAKGAKIYLLEYTKSSALKAKIRKQCVKNGWQYYIADSIGLE